MKFFSNFDTKLKYSEIERFKKEFGENNVLLIGKSRLFKLLKVQIPFLGYLIFLSGTIYFMYISFGFETSIYGGLVLFLLSSILVLPIIKQLIDFYMDFMIITPRLFIKYNQEGLFKRDYMTTYVVDVKSVVVKKSGIIYSIFDVGNLIFLSEGDQERTELSLNYVSDPEEKKARIIEIKNYGEELFIDGNDTKEVKNENNKRNN